MIRYTSSAKNPLVIKVRLDEIIVGEIIFCNGGWRYFPKGQKVGGELFKTLKLCQKSLEEDK